MRINYEAEVKKVYPDACLSQVRGLKLYIVEYTNPHSIYRSGLAYNTTKGTAWKSAYEVIQNKKANGK